MKIRLLIIDDEKPARDIIKYYLKDRKDVEILSECENGFDGFKAIRELKPDLIFLDVQMPKLSGFELLDILEDKPEVIFSTAFDQYAIKAFEQNAIDYLLKPFDKERFDQALEKAIAKIHLPHEEKAELPKQIAQHDGDEIQKIVVRNGNSVKILKPQDILYFTAEDDYVMIYTDSERYLKNTTMKFLESNLPRNFMRIHRSAIINLNAIKEVQTYKKDSLTVKMKNGEFVNASQSGAVKLRNYLK